MEISIDTNMATVLVVGVCIAGIVFMSKRRGIR